MEDRASHNTNKSVVRWQPKRRAMGRLQTEQLVTDRPASVMRAADGTIQEVFEWRPAEAVS